MILTLSIEFPRTHVVHSKGQFINNTTTDGETNLLYDKDIGLLRAIRFPEESK